MTTSLKDLIRGKRQYKIYGEFGALDRHQLKDRLDNMYMELARVKNMLCEFQQDNSTAVMEKVDQIQDELDQLSTKI